MMGFPVETVNPHPSMVEAMGETLLGAFVSVGLPVSDVSVEAVPTSTPCPFCHDPLWHLQVSGSRFGRIVGGDTQTAFVDVMPADLRCVACKSCQVFLYEACRA